MRRRRVRCLCIAYDLREKLEGLIGISLDDVDAVMMGLFSKCGGHSSYGRKMAVYEDEPGYR